MPVYNEMPVYGWAVQFYDPETDLTMLHSATFRRYRYEAEEERKRLRSWMKKGTVLRVVRVSGRVSIAEGK
jgi:hypothetical protein